MHVSHITKYWPFLKYSDVAIDIRLWVHLVHLADSVHFTFNIGKSE